MTIKEKQLKIILIHHYVVPLPLSWGRLKNKAPKIGALSLLFKLYLSFIKALNYSAAGGITVATKLSM